MTVFGVSFSFDWRFLAVFFRDNSIDELRKNTPCCEPYAEEKPLDTKLSCSIKVVTFVIFLFGFTHFSTDALTSSSDVAPGPVNTPQVSNKDKDFSEVSPKLNLRVNYGQDWVESFYEAGHTIWVTVTQSDGVTVKATNEATTGPRNQWGGEPGFQTTEFPWSDAAGNPMDNPPDIQPGDWVFARVDNGASAQVQIGDIRGEVRFDQDGVTGTIRVPWLITPVQVECLDWSSTKLLPASSQPAGLISPNGDDPYACSWDPKEWDVQPWQYVGVAYFTPDGHWVANALRDERWMAPWTGDLAPGSWTEGEHSYLFQMSYTLPDPGGDWTSPAQSLTVSRSATPLYPGKVLLQVASSAPRIAWTGQACEGVPSIHPDQATRFVWGWINDRSMTYEQALAHFTSLSVEALWDGDAGGSTPLQMGQLLPWNSQELTWEDRGSLTDHNAE